MTQKIQFSDLFEDKEIHRTILKAGLWFLLMLELVIFLWAAFHSGVKSTVAVYDANNNKIYQTEGAVMTTYERRIFESSYGPLSNYQIKVESRSVPFPFRAWLAVAVGAPIGVVLLLNYLVRAYLTFLGGEEPEKSSESETQNGPLGGQGLHPRFALRRLSVFSLGMLVVVCLSLIWLVPDFMAAVARVILAFVLQFKWFFLGLTVFAASLVVWIIYLRYKIQGKMMEHQVDLEKFRVEKQLLLESNHRMSLLGAPAASPETRLRSGNSGHPLERNPSEGPYAGEIREEGEHIEEADSDISDADTETEGPRVEVAEPMSHVHAEVGNWTDRLLKRHR
jgi:hypothetical protein